MVAADLFVEFGLRLGPRARPFALAARGGRGLRRGGRGLRGLGRARRVHHAGGGIRRPRRRGRLGAAHRLRERAAGLGGRRRGAHRRERLAGGRALRRARLAAQRALSPAGSLGPVLALLLLQHLLAQGLALGVGMARAAGGDDALHRRFWRRGLRRRGRALLHAGHFLLDIGAGSALLGHGARTVQHVFGDMGDDQRFGARRLFTAVIPVLQIGQRAVPPSS